MDIPTVILGIWRRRGHGNCITILQSLGGLGERDWDGWACDAAGLYRQSEVADWRTHLLRRQVRRDPEATTGGGSLHGAGDCGSRAVPGRGPAAGAHQAVGGKAEAWNDEHSRGAGAG